MIQDIVGHVKRHTSQKSGTERITNGAGGKTCARTGRDVMVSASVLCERGRRRRGGKGKKQHGYFNYHKGWALDDTAKQTYSNKGWKSATTLAKYGN